MTTTDCPFCGGPAEMPATLVDLHCEGCDVTIDVAPDPLPIRELERAA